MSQELSVQIPFYSYLKYHKSKNSAKYHKTFMSRFWEIVFFVPLVLRRHVCLSKFKHSASRELPLTAHKTVFSHLKRKILQVNIEYSRTSTNVHLSTTATLFGRQSIHWLFCRPLDNGHHLLSTRWSLWRDPTYYTLRVKNDHRSEFSNLSN